MSVRGGQRETNVCAGTPEQFASLFRNSGSVNDQLQQQRQQWQQEQLRQQRLQGQEQWQQQQCQNVDSFHADSLHADSLHAGMQVGDATTFPR